MLRFKYILKSYEFSLSIVINNIPKKHYFHGPGRTSRSAKGKSFSMRGKQFRYLVLSIFLLVSTSIKSGLVEELINEFSLAEWKNLKLVLPSSSNKEQLASVECISKRLIETLDEPLKKIDWEIVVFESEDVNAFAYPGGKIGIFSGLLNLASDQDEVAAVISHEIMHVILKHSYKKIKKHIEANIVMDIFDLESSDAEMLNNLIIQLPFSRKQEVQADLRGLSLMAKAGFNPLKSWFFWEKMGNQESSHKFLEFLQTHPHPTSRVELIKQSLPEKLREYNKPLNKIRCNL